MLRKISGHVSTVVVLLINKAKMAKKPECTRQYMRIFEPFLTQLSGKRALSRQVLAILFYLLPSCAFAMLAPYTATYGLYYHGLRAGNVTQVFQKLKHDNYLFTNTVEPVIAFLPYGGFERSIFKIASDTVMPLRYDFEKQEGTRQEGVILFDYKHHVAKESSTKNTGNLMFLPGDHDKQTYFLQLSHDLTLNKKNLTYKVVGDGKIRTYTFVKQGFEMLDTPMGKIKTLKLRTENEDRSRVTYIWLDPKREYLLIHIEQLRKGSLAGESTIESFAMGR